MKENNGLTTASMDPLHEQHNTPREIAARLSLSIDKVRRMFQDEPGVIVIGEQSTAYKRRYNTLRIPESVLQRVLRRLSNV